MQKYKSAETSLNQVPALFKKVPWVTGRINLDIGGGKYDTATKWLWDEHGVVNLVWDPYNRTDAHNDAVMELLVHYVGADTVTCANVLNVIEDGYDRLAVIRKAEWRLSAYGVAYFSVYEGDGTGVGRETKPGCWQNNLRTEYYVKEIAEVFKHVERKGKVIKAWKE